MGEETHWVYLYIHLERIMNKAGKAYKGREEMRTSEHSRKGKYRTDCFVWPRGFDQYQMEYHFLVPNVYIYIII